jgi:predicted TIM-barrel fold metal-dependent hydrolase
VIEFQGVKYRIVDAHTHWTKLISKPLKLLLGTLAIGEVVDNTIDRWNDIQKATKSSFECKVQLYLNGLDYFGIDRAILLPVFPFDAKFMINAEKYDPHRIIGFSALLPRKSNRLQKLEEFRKLGCRGLKLHPAFNFFHPKTHHNAIEEIFTYCQDHKIMILIHAGSHYEIRELMDVLRPFDELKLILAHMGMGSQTDQSIECARAFPNVILDMSSQPYFYLINQAVHDPDIGIERVVYGSDFPMLNPRNDLMKICQLPISESERQLIFAGNIEKFF